jgi:hypothetical protein
MKKKKIKINKIRLHLFDEKNRKALLIPEKYRIVT